MFFSCFANKYTPLFQSFVVFTYISGRLGTIVIKSRLIWLFFSISKPLCRVVLSIVAVHTLKSPLAWKAWSKKGK